MNEPSFQAWLARHRAERYKIDPPRHCERVDDTVYKIARHICAKWQPVKRSDLRIEDITGMNFLEISNMDQPRYTKGIYYSEIDKQVYLKDKSVATSADWPLGNESSVLISSHLLMYRLCCLFKGHVDVSGPQGYKSVWEVYMRHKSTGQLISFTEHKGSPSFYSSIFPPTDSEFDGDWVDLLNLLLDRECPHPYDGLVAGSVA